MPVSQEFCFGPFRLDAANARLMRGSQAIALQPKAFDVLAYLLEKAGSLVTQEELIDAVWPDTIVGDSSLKSCIRQIRQALGDGVKQPRFIETVHRRGYRFIAPLGEGSRDQESGDRGQEMERGRDGVIEGRRPHSFPPSLLPSFPPSPGALPGSPAPLLVGREIELAKLRRWLDKALAGQRQFVFVSGGPGSGKTTLVEALEREAADIPNLWVASGQCFEQFGSGEAYLPLLEAIGQLASAPGKELLVQLVARLAPTWLEQLPGLRHVLTSEIGVPRVASATPERMLREMAEVLEALTAQTPLLLVLEDLHWSDYSTLDLISALARRRQPTRLMVLATYRPVETVLSSHPLRQVKQDLQSRRLCHELPLGLLSEAAIAEYLVARFPGRQWPAGLPRLLHERTEGNPLFLVNLVDYWLADQSKVQSPQSTVDENAHFGFDTLDFGLVPVPASIRALIEKQLERLKPPERLVLEGASVAGVEFAAAAAAAAVEVEPLEAEGILEGLARQHHLLVPRGIADWPDGTASARYRFGHELYHRVVYEHVGEAQRRRLHERVGQRLEQACGAKPEEALAELALHFEKARAAESAVRYLGQAADRAARHFAPREAIDYLRRALAMVGLLPPSERLARELVLQMGLGLQLQATRGFAAPEAFAAYSRARELCAQAGEPPLLFPVLWGLWLYHKVRSELVTAREMAEQLMVLARQRCDSALELQSCQALAVTTLCLGQPAQARAHMERGAALYDPRRHPALTFLFGQDPGVACLAFGAVALWLLGYPEQAKETSRRAVGESPKSKVQGPKSKVRGQRSEVRGQTSDFRLPTSDFRPPTSDLRPRTLDFGLETAAAAPSTQALALHFAAMLHQLRRDRTAALDCAEQTLAIAADQGFSFWHAGGQILRGWAVGEVQSPESKVGGQRSEVRGQTSDLRPPNSDLGLDLLQNGIDAWAATGSVTYRTYYLALLAEMLDRHGRTEEGLERLEEGLALVEQTGEGLVAAELHRLRGELLLRRGGDSKSVEGQAEAAFRQALHVAGSQQARSLELRAATSLMRLCRKQGRGHEVRPVLAEIYHWFTEGFQSPDLLEARRLLDEATECGAPGMGPHSCRL